MARPRGFRSPIRTSVKRKSGWGLMPNTGAAGGGNQLISTTGSVAALGGVVVLLDGITLVRTRGELNLVLLTAAAQGDGFHGAFGIAKSTNSATAIGITALQTPISDETWDGWLYHRYFSLRAGGIINQGVSADEDQVNSVAAALRIEVDSKAMRKARADDAFYAALQVTEVGTATMGWNFNSRGLFKLA